MIRGGLGYLYSPTLPLLVRQAVTHPDSVPRGVQPHGSSRAKRQVAQVHRLCFAVALADLLASPPYGLIDTELNAPYTIQRWSASSARSAARWPPR